jgi:hypothetical protein
MPNYAGRAKAGQNNGLAPIAKQAFPLTGNFAPFAWQILSPVAGRKRTALSF